MKLASALPVIMLILLLPACTTLRVVAARSELGVWPDLGPALSLEEARSTCEVYSDWPEVLAMSQPGDEIHHYSALSGGAFVMGSEGYLLFRGNKLIREFGTVEY
jgi:hypothetical protein